MNRTIFRKTRLASSLALLTMMVSACTSLAPDYQRPSSPVADNWPIRAPQASSIPAAELAWQDFFIDARLRQVIAMALTENRDLRVAALNIEKTRAQYQIQQASSFPAINASIAGNAKHLPADLSGGTASTSHSYSGTLGVSAYELDVFGRIASLKDQALQQFLATEEAQRATRISLVAEIANAYLTLAADKQRLQLAQNTFDSQSAAHRIAQRSHEIGSASGLELAQSQSTVETARYDVANYISQVTRDTNALNLLVGKTVPESLLPEAMSVNADASLPTLGGLAPGLPSEVLLQRPDVQQAEHTLRAAQANIGSARAAFFPSISLTGSAGSASTDLTSLFKAGQGAWTFIPSISLPIFNAGSNRANLKVAETSRDIAVANYEKAIQTAFREVADALAQNQTIDQQYAARSSLAAATAKSKQLSEALYQQGAASYLTALDAQRSLYAAQQSLISTQLARMSNQVTLYKVLGGGWQAAQNEVEARP